MMPMDLCAGKSRYIRQWQHVSPSLILKGSTSRIETALAGLVITVLLTFAGCSNRPPAPDFTTLKRDLLELEQACGLDRDTALHHPKIFVASMNRLQNDNRLQREPRPRYAQFDVDLVLKLADLVQSLASSYVRQGALAELNWRELDNQHKNLLDAIRTAVAALEREEQHPPRPAPKAS